MGEGLAEWIVTAPDGEQTVLQMAYFDRSRAPVVMEIGPVLALEDVAGGKVCALASRVEPRDYADTARMLDRYSPAELIGFARRLDPGLTAQDFADAGMQLDRIADEEFFRYRLSQQDIAALCAGSRPGHALRKPSPAKCLAGSGNPIPRRNRDLDLSGTTPNSASNGPRRARHRLARWTAAMSGPRVPRPSRHDRMVPEAVVVRA